MNAVELRNLEVCRVLFFHIFLYDRAMASTFVIGIIAIMIVGLMTVMPGLQGSAYRPLQAALVYI